MNQRHLLLRLPEHDGPVSYVLCDGPNQVLAGEEASLDALAQRLRGTPVPVIRALAPGTRVLLTCTRVPSRKARALQRALPFALEEHLAGDVEELHCVPGPVDDDGTVPVAVVERDRMDRWGERLRAAGLEARALIPETAVLPLDQEEGGWLLWLEGDQAWVSMGVGQGFVADRENAATLLGMHLEEAGEDRLPARVLVLRHGAAQDTDAALGEQAAFGGVALARRESERSLLEAIAAALPARPPFDLLTGPYSRRAQLGRLWRPWRGAAVAALAWVLVLLVQLGVDIHRLRQLQARLDGEMTAVYEAAFPGSRAGGDPRGQMESALAAAGRGGGATGDDFQAVLTHAAPVLASIEGLELRSLRYLPGQMELELELATLQVLDGLKQRLERDPQWRVEIVSAQASDERVDGRIQIRRQGS